ncbi:TIGR00297 family protein [Methanocalculus taiwanensis]|uniref:TIGR00297 family protein n=1 Tax=Methanocalculus taiwanensis TaxID=106207 RepID=A0ABD4TKH4_9EURY|nr:TIGR00297 family protein [Methanocalculus taiwanensis]MCQ1538433.1 TIGR00297 family protein [Methanocalculus taiwanensis]
MKSQPRLLAATIVAILGILISPFILPAWLFAIFVISFSAVLYLIRGTQYISLALGATALLYGIGILPLVAFGATVGIVTLGELAYRAAGEGKRAYLHYTGGAFAGALLVMAYLGSIEPLVLIIGVLVALMLKSILEGRKDAYMIIMLGVAMTIFLFIELDFQVNILLLFVAASIALLFGYTSFRIGAADLSGLFSGAIIGVLLIVFADVRWFLVMLAFFIIGSASTRFKYAQKKAMGVEQERGGARGYKNAFSNGLVGTGAAVLFGLTGDPIWTALFVGSVATATADTVASEIGVTGGQPIMITTLKRVPEGTNGGVTIRGEAASLLGSCIIAGIAYGFQMIPLPVFFICLLAGFLGTNIDSLIGATLENSGFIGNAGTNLLATFGGGICAVMMVLLLV